MLNKGMLLVRKPKTSDVVVERVTLEITAANASCSARVRGSKFIRQILASWGLYIPGGDLFDFLNSSITLLRDVRPPAAIEIFGKLSPIIPDSSNPGRCWVRGEVIPLTTPAGTMEDVEIKYYYGTLPSS